MREPPDYHFYGGPKDGEPLDPQPGDLLPSQISHADWIGGYYVYVSERDRYEWRTTETKR